MVRQDLVIETLEELFALFSVQLIDIFGDGADREDALPACDWVGAHDRVDGSQSRANVLRRAARGLIQLASITFNGAVETIANESGSEALEELLIWPAEIIKDGITRCPQSVTTVLGQLGQTKAGVVGGHSLELNIAVPSSGVISLLALSISRFIFEELLALQ